MALNFPRRSTPIRRPYRALRLESLEHKTLMAADAGLAVAKPVAIESSLEDMLASDPMSLDAPSSVESQASFDSQSMSESRGAPDLRIGRGDAAFESLEDLFQAGDAGHAIEDLPELNEFNALDSVFGELGAGSAIDDALNGGGTRAGGHIHDPLTGGNMLGDDSQDDPAAGFLRVSTDSLTDGIASVGPSTQTVRVEPGTVGSVVIWTQTNDDGSRVVSREYYDRDGNMLSIWTKATFADGSAYQSAQDGDGNVVQTEWYDENGEEITEGGEGVDELQNPEYTDGTGWTPHWIDEPDHQLDPNDSPDQVLIVGESEANWLGDTTEPQWKIDPQVTVINPDPETGYPRELNPEDATPIPMTNPNDQVLPPDPSQL